MLATEGLEDASALGCFVIDYVGEPDGADRRGVGQRWDIGKEQGEEERCHGVDSRSFAGRAGSGCGLRGSTS
jgi:hypothetical protein